MNALARFVVHGMEDADRRIEAVFAPASFDRADHYLLSSAIVAALDRATIRLAEWWRCSETFRLASATHSGWAGAHWRERYRTIALVLIIAAGVHVAATIMQGDQPGWFWVIVPALTAAFAVIVLIASRSTQSRT